MLKSKHVFLALLLATALQPIQLLAHGEDKLGPHKGYIRMPGSFHTEVKQQSPSSFVIYLLDMHWKNPSTHRSEVTAHVMRSIEANNPSSNQKIPLLCTAHRTSYLCQTTQGIAIQEGDQLFLQTTRDGQTGGVVTYDLPLRLTKTNTAHSAHSGH
jgi:hypothetical protein